MESEKLEKGVIFSIVSLFMVSKHWRICHLAVSLLSFASLSIGGLDFSVNPRGNKISEADDRIVSLFTLQSIT